MKRDFYGDVYIGKKKVDTIFMRSIPEGSKKERELDVMDELLSGANLYKLAWVKKPNGLYDVKKGFRVIETTRGLRRNPIDSMRVYAGRDGFEITDFKKGDRIELHPATDLWMRGARYGKIIQVGRTNLKVKLDYLRRAIAVSPRNIGQIVTRDYYR